MNIELLVRIAEWLEAGAPEAHGVVGFDISHSLRFTDCGTTACIAGAAVAFSGELDHIRETFIKDEVIESEGEDEPGWWEVRRPAREALDLTLSQTTALFTPWDPEVHRAGWPDEHSFVREDQAASVIRRLIATGSVDWAPFGPYEEKEEEE